MKRDSLLRGGYEEERKLIGCMVGEVLYGIDIMRIREIVNPAPVIEVPAAPPYVVGMADHREAVVPIVDLRLRFGLPQTTATRRTKWIIVEALGKDVGLLVDGVTDVLRLRTQQRREVPPLLSDRQALWIRDVWGADHQLVFELDLDAVAGRASEIPALDSVGEPNQ
ncbi:MAG: chemotaxis protein CheW [Myxococcota bacterium]|jgi:purine-binding chemotaxis protein CheW|nr:chemotaxis protein CheW [Myxococcota bacterium]